MPFSTSKPVVGQLLSLTRPNGSHMKVPPSVVMAKNTDDLPPPASQLSAKAEKLQLKAISRRQMVSLASISSLSLAGPAEARMTRAEMKSKLLEKLREMRERLGFPEKKDESTEQTSSSSQKDKDNEEKTSEKDNVGEENKYVPQEESRDGEKKPPPTPTSPPPSADESQKPESGDGERTPSPSEKKDENPLLPFLNLNEVDVEPLVEGTLSR